MKLYRGSHVEVRNPKILTVARIGDFGNGFYTTTSLEQARRWATIRARQARTPNGIVTVFEAPDSLFENPELNIRSFQKADVKWLDFVMANRKDTAFEHKFDLVRGPVADDRVYICLNALENGTADRATVLRQLKTFVLADQILFHTAKSLLFLEYADTEVVPCSRQ
ncbi:MAG: DUF3990 domain-containing protein [Victivallaceae bacterium]|nr:DUF3990 domain-containing protein [Victivallaceae bacterium]